MTEELRAENWTTEDFIEDHACEIYYALGYEPAKAYTKNSPSIGDDIRQPILNRLDEMHKINTAIKEREDYINNRIKGDFRTYLMQNGEFELLGKVNKKGEDDV